MDKEKEFKEEYRELLNKYGVSLFIETSLSEWGSRQDIFFSGPGITFIPRKIKIDKGYCGMGG